MVSAWITLAVALASATAVFAVAKVYLLEPFPFPSSKGLVSVGEVNPSRGDLFGAISPADFDLLRQRDLFASLSAATPALANIRTSGYLEELVGKSVSPEFFSMTGLRPLLGRVIVESDAASGAPPVAVLSYSLWRSHFGGSPDVLRRTLSIKDQAYRIVGVLPRELERFDRAAFWIPFRLAEDATNRVPYLVAIGRLRPGSTIESVRRVLASVAHDLEKRFPETNRGYVFRIRTLREQTLGDFGRPLRALILAASIFWLVACANVSTVLLARSAGRERETAIRKALGASVRRIVSGPFFEAAVLSGAAFVAAAPVAVLELALIRKTAPAMSWQIEHASIDARVLLFGALFAGVTALVFGAIPATWTALAQPQHGLVGSRPGRSGWGLRSLGGLLVAAEVMLALPLLAGAGWIVGSLWRLYHSDLGLKPERVYIADLWLFDRRYKSPDAQRALFGALLERTREAPEVESAGLILWDPLPRGPRIGRRFRIEGTPTIPKETWPEATVLEADPGYLSMIGVPLLAGRPLWAKDPVGASQFSVVVSESFARQFLESSPLGRGLEIEFPSGTGHGLVVGVVGDVAAWPSLEKRPTIYVNFLQHPIGIMTLVVRSRADAEAIGAALHRVVSRIDPDLPVREVRSLKQSLDYGVTEARFVVTLLEAFGALALILSATGFFSVVAHLVERRRTEIGIRTALGAHPIHILRVFVGGMTPWLFGGLAAGILAATQVARLGRNLLPGPTPAPGLTLLVALLVLAIAGLIGASIPANRAARRDPLDCLRHV
jgi:putative ABC transport system permease protein